MQNLLERKFRFKENHTDLKTEIMAGFVTFLTMAYVLATVPNILGKAGFDRSGVLVSMILLIIITSVAMALSTNRPFALAPGLGSVSVVSGMVANEGIPTNIASGIIILSGLLFVLISFFGLREAVVKVIPKSLKYALSAGIGLFIALIGAKGAGLVVGNSVKNCLNFGNLSSPSVILTAIGFVLILVFKALNLKGNLIIAIIITTIIGIPMGVTKLPASIVAVPTSFGAHFLDIDIIGALNFAYIPFLIALFVPDFFSTFGTVLGVGAQAGYLDENGDLPGIDTCFKVDAISTVLGGLFCMPCMTTYLESSAGVESGGRTGFTVIATSFFFLLAVFFAPLALMIPSAATAPALIYIGINMLGGMKNIDYSDMSEYIPAFICVTFTIFANNVANGICTALPAYLILKIANGKIKEVPVVLYVLVAVCILYFVTII